MGLLTSNRVLMVIVVCLVAAIIVVAYFAFVGVKRTAEDMGLSEDPTGQERPPIAYAVINFDCSVMNVYDGFSGTITIDGVVHDYYQTQTVYTYDKMGPLFWWELEDDVVVWVTAKITGPASYNAPTFTSDKVEDSIPELYIGSGDVHEYDFGPYTADFYDPGTYTVTASLIVQWDEGWDEPQKIATATKTLNVS